MLLTACMLDTQQWGQEPIQWQRDMAKHMLQGQRRLVVEDMPVGEGIHVEEDTVVGEGIHVEGDTVVGEGMIVEEDTVVAEGTEGPVRGAAGRFVEEHHVQ